MVAKVAINGFGRIGRLVLRAILESGRKDIEVVAINDLGPVETNAHLLRFDSVHGRFPHEVKVEGDTMVVDGHKIKVTAIKDPAELPHKALGVDVALECTGIFTAREKAAAHLNAGAKRVLISAPAEGADLTVVYGVNDDKLTKDHLVVSNASCTTNCLAPVVKVLNDAIGIEHGFMTTIHSYTGDQPTLDTLHKDLYRARGAALSMIPTTTGAAKAVGLVLPELKGKLDGSAIRVPTPNVSVIDLKFVAKRATNKDEINNAIKATADGNGPLKGILGYTDQPNVSSDFNHDDRSSIFHLDQTKVIDGTFRARPVLVRQRMGLLQPHGRHGCRDGEAHLSFERPRGSNDPPPGSNSAAERNEDTENSDIRRGAAMSKPFRTLDDADVSGKRVLLRVDLNVPTENGRVTDTTRIERVASTIEEIAARAARSSCSPISAGRRVVRTKPIR